jgi:hypothetical protein
MLVIRQWFLCSLFAYICLVSFMKLFQVMLQHKNDSVPNFQ